MKKTLFRKLNFISCKSYLSSIKIFPFSGKITPRNVLVIDEAHNTESVLSTFVEMGISQYFAEKIIKVKWPAKVTPVNFVKWVLTDYYPKLQSQILLRKKIFIFFITNQQLIHSQ